VFATPMGRNRSITKKEKQGKGDTYGNLLKKKEKNTQVPGEGRGRRRKRLLAREKRRASQKRRKPTGENQRERKNTSRSSGRRRRPVQSAGGGGKRRLGEEAVGDTGKIVFCTRERICFEGGRKKPKDGSFVSGKSEDKNSATCCKGEEEKLSFNTKRERCSTRRSWLPGQKRRGKGRDKDPSLAVEEKSDSGKKRKSAVRLGWAGKDKMNKAVTKTARKRKDLRDSLLKRSDKTSFRLGRKARGRREKERKRGALKNAKKYR